MCGLSGDIVAVLRHISMVILTVFLAWLSDYLCRKLIVPAVIKLTKKTEVAWDDVLFNRRVLVSACHIVPALVVWQLLPLVFFQYPVVRELLTRLTAIYITVMATLTAVTFISSFKLLESDRRTSAQQYFQSFCGVLKIVIIFLAVIVVVAIVFNKSPLSLIAGLGATSAVLMLVFKDTIEGLVAGVRLTSNEMLHKGDWITVSSVGADGTVEDMSLTTVKIRNFDNTIVTISPKTLVDGSFQNWKGMQEKSGRRLSRQMFFDVRSIRIADADLKKSLVEKRYFKAEEIGKDVVNMTLFRKYVERWLAQRDDVLAGQTLMVRQMKATSSGLPLEIYCFLKQQEWVPYEHHLAEIMEHIYAIAPDFGLKIYQMFPEQ